MVKTEEVCVCFEFSVVYLVPARARYPSCRGGRAVVERDVGEVISRVKNENWSNVRVRELCGWEVRITIKTGPGYFRCLIGFALLMWRKSVCI